MRYLVKEVLKPHFETKMWEGFRTDKIWTLEIDDLMKSNLKEMKALFSVVFKGRKEKKFSYNDAKLVFLDTSELQISPE